MTSNVSNSRAWSAGLIFIDRSFLHKSRRFLGFVANDGDARGRPAQVHSPAFINVSRSLYSNSVSLTEFIASQPNSFRVAWCDALLTARRGSGQIMTGDDSPEFKVGRLHLTTCETALTELLRENLLSLGDQT